MNTLFAAVAWCILFVLCWPLALLVLVLWPLVWLLALPFRLVGITFTALFAFLQALLFLPARVLGWRPHAQAAHSAQPEQRQTRSKRHHPAVAVKHDSALNRAAYA